MKNPSLRAPALLLAASGIMCCACASQPPAGTSTNTYTGDQAGKRTESVGDRDLAARFVMLNIRSETREGRMRVQFELKNTTPGDLAVEWAIRWSDSNGFLIDTSPHWTPAIVTGQGFHAIQAVAPAAEARVWQLELRRPTPVK